MNTFRTAMAAGSLLTLDKCVCALKKESVILKRLVYKNKNQHRRDRNFQKIRGVSKDLERFRSFQLTELLHKSRRNPRTAEWSREDNRLNDIRIFLNQLTENCKECFEGCRRQLFMSVFIPVNLLFSSLMSRLWVLANIIGNYIVEFFSIPSPVHKMRIQVPYMSTASVSVDIGEPVTLMEEEALKRKEILAKTNLPNPVETAPHEIEAKPKTHSFKPNFIKLYQPTRRGVVVLKSCHPHIIRRISRWREGRTRRQPYLRFDNMFNHPKYSHWTLQVKLK